MLVSRYGNGLVVKQCRQRFPRRLAVQTKSSALCITDQPRALEQPLCIDHGIVGALGNTAFELGPLTAASCLQRVFSPAPQGNRNDPINRRVPGRNFPKGLFHHPVKTNVGDGGGRIGERRQTVDHITQRRGFNQQYRCHGAGTSRSRAAVTRSGYNSTRHLRCPSGHSRLKHGPQSTGIDKIATSSLSGGVKAGEVEP